MNVTSLIANRQSELSYEHCHFPGRKEDSDSVSVLVDLTSNGHASCVAQHLCEILASSPLESGVNVYFFSGLASKVSNTPEFWPNTVVTQDQLSALIGLEGEAARSKLRQILTDRTTAQTPGLARRLSSKVESIAMHSGVVVELTSSENSLDYVECPAVHSHRIDAKNIVVSKEEGGKNMVDRYNQLWGEIRRGMHSLGVEISGDPVGVRCVFSSCSNPYEVESHARNQAQELYRTIQSIDSDSSIRGRMRRACHASNIQHVYAGASGQFYPQVAPGKEVFAKAELYRVSLRGVPEQADTGPESFCADVAGRVLAHSSPREVVEGDYLYSICTEEFEI